MLGDAFEIDPVTVIFGGGAYVMIALMAATSSDRTAAWLGRRRWRLLHLVGVYWIWIIFANSYTARAVMAIARGSESLAYVPVALFVWALLGVRIAAWLRARPARRVAAVASPLIRRCSIAGADAAGGGLRRMARRFSPREACVWTHACGVEEGSALRGTAPLYFASARPPPHPPEASASDQDWDLRRSCSPPT